MEHVDVQCADFNSPYTLTGEKGKRDQNESLQVFLKPSGRSRALWGNLPFRVKDNTSLQTMNLSISGSQPLEPNEKSI